MPSCTTTARRRLQLIGPCRSAAAAGPQRHVPRAQYVNGERRSFALLRPTTDAAGQERVRDLVLQAYAEYEGEQVAEAAS
jgi:hypothetical protein